MITADYAKRRNKLMQLIGSDSILILPAAPIKYRNGDASFSYRQNSDFYYLTGFEEPEAILVLIPKRKEGSVVFFTRPRDRSKELWDGPRAGLDGVCKDYGADEAFDIHSFNEILPKLLLGKKSIHYPVGMDPDFDTTIIAALQVSKQKLRSGVSLPECLQDVSPSLHELRLIKSAGEIKLMQKAASISSAAHVQAMQKAQSGMYEYEIEAELMRVFYANGAREVAYTPIIGSGPNSCILHYNSNNRQMQSGELLLIDAGCEFNNYAADITRTFPVNGRFTAEQKAIYEIVLNAQLAAIKSLKVGSLWSEAQRIIIEIITIGLKELGLLKGNVKDLIANQAYAPFYMHNSGHWLGLDVHDVGAYKVNGKWRKLQAGMVLTVEPGIYISADIPGVPKKWHNIGVRIEDDILITTKGSQSLSDVPKTVSEIESIMQHKNL